MNKKLSSLVVLSAALLLTATGVPSSLAGPQPDKNATDANGNPNINLQEMKKYVPGHNYKRDKNEFRANTLYQVPDVPELPRYTGTDVSFGWGEEFPNASAGKVVAYTFFTSDPPAKIVQFYQQRLSASGWMVDQYVGAKDASRCGIDAIKGRSVCRISIQPGGPSGYSVRIHFHAASS